MMDISIVLVVDNTKEVTRLLREYVDIAVRKVALDIEGTAKNLMTHSSPPPSQPGEPPGVDTGTLKNSIRAARAGDKLWTVGTNVYYAPYLEFGTRRMASRPFMRPAAEIVKNRVPQLVREVFK